MCLRLDCLSCFGLQHLFIWPAVTSFQFSVVSFLFLWASKQVGRINIFWLLLARNLFCSSFNFIPQVKVLLLLVGSFVYTVWLSAFFKGSI